MKKFLVLFLTPVSVLENWMKTDPAERQATEDKMKVEWQEWVKANKSYIVDIPAGAGKTKVVNKEGVSDTKNNIMLYGTVQAGSHEEAASLFVGHPHLGIPEATIEIMEINQLNGLDQ